MHLIQHVERLKLCKIQQQGWMDDEWYGTSIVSNPVKIVSCFLNVIQNAGFNLDAIHNYKVLSKILYLISTFSTSQKDFENEIIFSTVLSAFVYTETQYL